MVKPHILPRDPMAEIVDIVAACEKAVPKGYVILRLNRTLKKPQEHVRLFGKRGGPLGRVVGIEDTYITVDFHAAEVLKALKSRYAL